MKSVKKLSGKRILKMPFGIGFLVLLISVMGLFASCDSPTMNRPSSGETGVGAKTDPALMNTLLNERYPKSVASDEVLRYNSFVSSISQQLGKDSSKIPRFFMVNVSDFLQVMGVPDSVYSKLPHKFGHARIYISLDTLGGLHLFLTPVNNARIYSECDNRPTNWGSDTVVTDAVAYPPCCAMISRYGGQQAVDSIFGAGSNKRMVIDSLPILFDLSGLCPPCDLGILTSNRFFGNQ
jgi:hypothetical protein